ncbi:hypothetical protein [Persicitalea sp.]|uniref:hypothetical protein n=1 Tax=Persicitalea sp. TaxID=3100273 RepID=UPI0035937511
MKKKTVFLFIVALFAIGDTEAQDNIGLRFVFGTLHPYGEQNAFLMPNKLDENAVIVPNWGFIASYQRYFHKKRWAIKFAQGAYSDCAQLFAGHTHLGLRLNVLAHSPRHSLEVGFGPTLVYRQSWYRFDGYVQETRLLKTSGNWQWNFVWYGGEIEYDYKITKNIDLTLNVIPGYPQFYTFGIGARYWLRPIGN